MHRRLTGRPQPVRRRCIALPPASRRLVLCSLAVEPWFLSFREGGGSRAGSGSGLGGSGACCASCSLVHARFGVWLGWCLAVCSRRAWVASPGGRLVVPRGALLAAGPASGDGAGRYACLTSVV